MISVLIYLEKMPQNEKIQLVDESLEKTNESDFWNYIEEKGGFSRCPTCDSRPKIIRKFEKETRYLNESSLPWIDINFNEDFGEIYNLHCCEHLYDFQDKKRYIRFQNLNIYNDLDLINSSESYDKHKSKRFMTTVCKISSKNRDDIYRKINSMSCEYIEYTEFNSKNLFVEVDLKSQVKDEGIIKYLNPRYLLKNNLKSKLFFFL